MDSLENISLPSQPKQICFVFINGSSSVMPREAFPVQHFLKTAEICPHVTGPREHIKPHVLPDTEA